MPHRFQIVLMVIAGAILSQNTSAQEISLTRPGLPARAKPEKSTARSPGAFKGTGGTGLINLIDSVTIDSGEDGADEARGILVDDDGNVWVTGYLTRAGHGRDIWLAKYDRNLVYQDSVIVDGPDSGDDEGYTMVFDQNGYLYLVGYMSANGQGHDIWIGKFDADLDLVDDFTLNGSENDHDDGYGILFDEVSGNLYAAGTLRETGEGANIWVAVFNTDLTLLDSTLLDGPASDTDKARFLTFDGSRHLFASGSATQAVTDYDIWLGKFDDDLTFVDDVIVAGPTTDEDKGYGIVFNGTDTIFVTGTMIESSESYNIWMAAYDTDLTPLDDLTIDGPMSGEDVAYTMVMDEVGRLHPTGVYTEADGGSNIWVARFNSELELESWITVDGPAGGYDTGVGVAYGVDGDLYVSAIVSDDTEGLNIWIGRFGLATLFADGFESGDSTDWTIGCSGTVGTAAAARSGSYGLETTVAATCGSANDVEVRDMTVSSPVHIESCSSISAGDGVVVADGGQAYFTAGEGVVFLNGFSVASGGSLAASNHESLPYSMYVQDDSPDAETTYNVEFRVNLDDLALGSGEEVEHFVAYDGVATPVFQLILRHGEGFVLEAWDDFGSASSVSGGVATAGWNKIELSWEASASAEVSVTVNDGTPGVLAGLDTDSYRIEFARWGMAGGSSGDGAGTIRMDDFITWP